MGLGIFIDDNFSVNNALCALRKLLVIGKNGSLWHECDKNRSSLRCSVIRHRWMKLYAGNTLAFCSGSICFHYPNPKSCYPLLLCPSSIVTGLLCPPPLSSVTARNCPKAFKLRWKVKAKPQVIWFGHYRNGHIWLTILEGEK